MTARTMLPSRRQFVAGGLVLGTAAFAVPGVLAEELLRTPGQTEGPFYPTRLPLDTDNDLLVINDTITPADGEITHLSGRIMELNGEPIKSAVVEIWQADSHGAYLHERSANRDHRDSHFQGFGRFLTGSTGEYYFRTIKPVPYSGRTPHIHFAVKRKGQGKFTTQCYIKGHPGNERDGLWRSVRDPRAREAITVAFEPVKESKIGEFAARFNIVLGFTPEA